MHYFSNLFWVKNSTRFGQTYSPSLGALIPYRHHKFGRRAVKTQLYLLLANGASISCQKLHVSASIFAIIRLYWYLV
jgi:hypothetical protein